jgi:hypothetical protein
MNDTKEKHATFTPGPWHDSGKPEYEIYKGNNPIASVIPSFTAEDEANARLIAAAPEMYDVLSELFDTLGLSRGYGFDEEYDKIREVLAKVDGGEG